MSADNYPSKFSRQMATIVYLFYEFALLVTGRFIILQITTKFPVLRGWGLQMFMKLYLGN